MTVRTKEKTAWGWRSLALGPLIAPILFALIAATATVLTDGYSSIRENLSLLAAPGRPHSYLINAGFITYGLLVQGLGPMLYRLAGGGRVGGALWALVGIYGGGAVLAGYFADRHVTPVLFGLLREDEAHTISAQAAFAAVAALLFVTPWALSHLPTWREWRRFSIVLGVLTLVIALPFQMQDWPELSGLLQRGFFATTMIWVLGTSLRLFVSDPPDTP